MNLIKIWDDSEDQLRKKIQYCLELLGNTVDPDEMVFHMVFTVCQRRWSTFCLLAFSADSFDPDQTGRFFFTPVVYLKTFFVKLILKKKQMTSQKNNMKLTHKASPIICSRRQFQILLLFQK